MLTLFVPRESYREVIRLLKAQEITYTIDPMKGNGVFYFSLPVDPSPLICMLLEKEHKCYMRSEAELAKTHTTKFKARIISPFTSSILFLLLTSIIATSSQAATPSAFISLPRKGAERSPEDEARYAAYKERRATRRYDALKERKRQYDFKQELALFNSNRKFYEVKYGTNDCGSGSGSRNVCR
jgi:hypothetical protein